MDVFEVDYDQTSFKNIVSYDEFRSLHKKAFCLELRNGGNIYLRYSKWSEFVKMQQKIMSNSEVSPLYEELQIIQKIDPDMEDEDLKKKATAIIEVLEPFFRERLISCIVAPKVETIQDLDVLYMSMDSDERLQLDAMLSILSAPVPNSRLDGSIKMLADVYHVQVVSVDDIPELTIQQMTLLGGL